MDCIQIDIYGNKKILKKKNKKVSICNQKEIILKNKIKELYKMYEQLYESLNIDLMEQNEVVIKNNIIAFIEDRQAEPLELINLALCENIDYKINKMKEVLYANDII